MKMFFILLVLSLSCSDSKQKEKEVIIQEKNKAKVNNIVSDIDSLPVYDKYDEKDELKFEYEIIGSIPHDTRAYTQGYKYYNGYLYESTGQYGFSSIRKINPITGEILKKEYVNLRFFSEGIEIYDGKIFMLTWKNSICKVYDLETFGELNEFRYTGEGWGLCFGNGYFYMSNGSNIIQMIEPKNFSVVDKFELFDNEGYPLMDLNELELAKGFIFANLWMRDKIAVIDPTSKSLVKIMDFSDLRGKLKNYDNAETMNGIAYNKNNDIFYITGKNWDTTFLVKIK